MRRFVVFCIAAAMIIGSCGCGKLKENGDDMQKVVLNEVAHSCFYAPMYVAIEEGYFEDMGIELKLVTGDGADKAMAGLLAGEADIAFMGSETAVYAYAEGVEDYVVNFAQMTQRAGNFLVARQPIENFSWDMLKGKKVLGGRAGGMPEMVFEFILEKHGIDPAMDITIDQSIDFGVTASAFSGGRGDFSVEFEPSATMLEKKGDGYVVASLGEASGYVPYTAFLAKRSFLEQKPDIVQRFTDALQRGMNYVHNHTPKEIAKIIAPQFPGMDEDTLILIIERYYEQNTWKTDLVFHEDAYNLLINILMDAGVLEKTVPYADLVNTKFAEKAVDG